VEKSSEVKIRKNYSILVGARELASNSCIS
jgi:hypothetical protein